MHQPTFCQLPVRPLPVILGIVPLGQGHLSGRRLQCRDTSYRAARTTLSVRSAAQSDKTLTAFAVGAPGKTPSYLKTASLLRASRVKASLRAYMEFFNLLTLLGSSYIPLNVLPVLQTKSDEVLECPTLRDKLEPRWFSAFIVSFISLRSLLRVLM